MRGLFGGYLWLNRTVGSVFPIVMIGRRARSTRLRFWEGILGALPVGFLIGLLVASARRDLPWSEIQLYGYLFSVLNTVLITILSFLALSEGAGVRRSGH